MKAALEAWGAGSNLFHQGVAKETAEPEVVAATMSKPGVVLRRAVGSDGPFREHPALPTGRVARRRLGIPAERTKEYKSRASRSGWWRIWIKYSHHHRHLNLMAFLIPTLQKRDRVSETNI